VSISLRQLVAEARVGLQGRVDPHLRMKQATVIRMQDGTWQVAVAYQWGYLETPAEEPNAIRSRKIRSASAIPCVPAYARRHLPWWEKWRVAATIRQAMRTGEYNQEDEASVRLARIQQAYDLIKEQE
jgi:hypothetical protein